MVVVPESGRSQFTRFVQDFINTPLGGANQILAPYFQFRILHDVEYKAPTTVTVTTPTTQ